MMKLDTFLVAFYSSRQRVDNSCIQMFLTVERVSPKFCIHTSGIDRNQHEILTSLNGTSTKLIQCSKPVGVYFNGAVY